MRFPEHKKTISKTPKQKTSGNKRSPRGTFLPQIDEALAWKMHADYTDNNTTFAELSAKYGYSKSSIHEAFGRFGLPKRVREIASPSPAKIRRMLALYEEGRSFGEIRAKLNISLSNARFKAILQENGVQVRNRAEDEAVRWKRHRAVIPKIIEGYKRGVSVPRLAREYGVNPSFCYSWLRKSGVAIRHHNDAVYRTSISAP